jgi:hypothetical protein
MEKSNEARARGVLPTFVSDDLVVLCKSSPTIRNSYEIRLALYMAFTRNSKFILAVRHGAKVDPVLRAHLEQHGGSIQEMEISDYSVYVGHSKPDGEEGDGWVLGDSKAHSKLCATLRSDWCRKRIAVGSSLAGADIGALERVLIAESISQTNIDDENVRDALLALAHAAKTVGGTIFVQ